MATLPGRFTAGAPRRPAAIVPMAAADQPCGVVRSPRRRGDARPARVVSMSSDRPAPPAAVSVAPPPAASPTPVSMTYAARVSVLVPYRPDGAERDRNWAYLRARYAARHPEWEVVEAPGPPGEFSRAAAICDAAARATGDVFLVVDADVWCDGVDDAVARVAAGAAWADPARGDVVRMTRQATADLVSGGAFTAAGAPTPLRRVACGGAVAVSRAAFLRCPPDRRFVGWGGEDHAWAADLTREYGQAAAGDRPPLWHLWHRPVAARSASRVDPDLMAEHFAVGGRRG